MNKAYKKVSIYQGAISHKDDYQFPLTLEQADDLRHALAVLDKYKKQLPSGYKDSDWHMIEFGIDGKNNVLHLIVESGMAG